ncbi:MAG: hypothetical protein HY552_04760 [Elusimicrobia bacterium]|nr:hypothetical protein [Elusimicrobiota bacterium]
MNPLLALLLRVPLHGLGLLVAPLPRAGELKLGRALGRLALKLDPKRRRIAEENMRRCLPDLSDAQRGKLLRANYEHYGVLVLELAHMFAPLPGHWRAYARRAARVEGFDNWRRAHAKGRGTLICSAHLADWELMAAAGAMAGVPATIVTRRLKPDWLHRWMEKTRRSTGVACAYQPRTMPAVLKALRRGESIGFVMDQYMPPPMGAPLRFLGASVDTLTAIAPLARRTDAAIVPVSQVRDPDGTVRIVFEPEFPLTEDDAADNQRLAGLVERWIRAEPAQWLWVHRRFKHAVWPDAPKDLDKK